MSQLRHTYLNHMSIDHPVTCAITKRGADNRIVIRSFIPLPQILVGDPIICKYIDGSQEYVLTCEVLEVLASDSFLLFVSKVEKFENLRRHDRYAVSLNAIVTGINETDYVCVTVKSLSLSGMAINCSCNYKEGTLLNANIIISSEDSIRAIGRIVRKLPIQHYCEYGVEWTSITDANRIKLNAYLDFIAESERRFLEDAIK